MAGLELELRMLEFEHRLRPVRIMVVHDVGRINIDAKEIELPKGSEIEVPHWLAEAMVERGLAKLVETPISLEDIARIHFSTISARAPSDIEQLPQHFYQEAKAAVKRLVEQARRELNPVLLEEAQKMMQYLVEITDKRITLILQSLRSPTSLAELSSKLSPEEAALLRELSGKLELWKRHILPAAKP